ncbi:MAG: paraquat-inducible membrane protein A [Limimaricola sp.]|uniref:paraquat-inducible protein A n=1 Tax=Limimaricola sp. TaxID=2211665 RepID=UPI001E061A1B|nr:paraquat-inducible protein A [Limimaricola sp.]MBI1418456.1 paraquat-inducible membrane protein A [Limimaricola sp.]
MAGLKFANLGLLLLMPLAWFAPLLRAGYALPLFGLKDITVISGLQSLWGTDAAFALVVTAIAIFIPYTKALGLTLVQFRLLSDRALPALHVLGKLAMAEVFLLALYIVLVKGIGHVRIETAWGLWLLTFCILANAALGALTHRALRYGPPREARAPLPHRSGWAKR